MDWTWAQAWQMTYMSIGLVLAILVMLALATGLIGVVFGGRAAKRSKAEQGKDRGHSSG